METVIGTQQQNPAQAVNPDIEKAVLGLYGEEFNDMVEMRRDFDAVWHRNTFGSVGLQWITYKGNSRQWVRADVPEGITPVVTNKFAKAANDLTALLCDKKTVLRYSPMDDNPEDYAGSKAADKISSILRDETREDGLRPMLARWMAMTGNGYEYCGYSKSDEHGMVDLYKFQCPQCGEVHGGKTMTQCHRCGAPVSMMTDESGMPMTEQYPRGAMTAEVRSPLEIYFDIYGRTIEESPVVFVSVSMALDEIKRRWPETSEKVLAEKPRYDTGAYILSQMAVTTPPLSGNTESQFSSLVRNAIGKNRAMVTECMRRPCKEWPRGLYGIVCNGRVLESHDELPYVDINGNPCIPIVHYKVHEVVGCALGSTPLNDCWAVQTKRNKYEAFSLARVHKGSAPVLVYPDSMKNKNQFTGIPGEHVAGNALDPGWFQPFYLQTNPLDAILRELIRDCDEEMKDIVAIYDAWSGKQPVGTPTASGLAQLIERTSAAYRDTFMLMDAAVKRKYEYLFGIFKTFVTEERAARMLGDNGKWEIEKFSSMDLNGNIAIHVDVEASEYRSRTARMASLDLALKNKLVDTNDPKSKAVILRRIGESDLAADIDVDTRDAAEEWDTFLKTGQVRFNPEIDNNLIHYSDHLLRCKTDEYRDLPLHMQKTWYDHTILTGQRIAQTAMAPPQGAPATPPGAPPMGALMGVQ